jgi:VWFA-related protein
MMRPAVFLSLVIASVGGIIGVAGQQPLFRSRADTVSLYATVVDREGRIVTDLSRDEFTVLDEGVPQQLTVFASEVQPIAIVLLLDRSDSIRERFEVASEAASEFVEYLLPEDRARIGSFSDITRLSPSDFTGDQKALKKVLSDDLLNNGSVTLLWNAAATAMDALNQEQRRRVLLLFTDGMDTPMQGRTVTFDQVKRRSQAEDVMVYSIGLVNERCISLNRSGGFRFQGRRRGGAGRVGIPTVRRPPGMPRVLPPLGGLPPWSRPNEPVAENQRACSRTPPDPTLRELSDVSGGGYFEIDKPRNLSSTFARIAQELHQQYTLAYPMPARDGKLHHVNVQVKRPGLTVRARRSYIAPDPLPAPGD